MDADQPHLVNAVQYSELHPDFELLPHPERVSLKVGDVAKVCMRFKGHKQCGGERFWILITSSDNGIYAGTVDNTLNYTEFHGLKNGDIIAFDYRHIYDYERGPFPKG